MIQNYLSDLQSQLSISNPTGFFAHSIRRDAVGIRTVRISLPVNFVHPNLCVPAQFDDTTANQSIGTTGIDVDQIHQAWSSCSHRGKFFRQAPNQLAIEWIVEKHQKRRARPMELQRILLKYANRR